MALVINLDVLFLNDLVMTLILLWAAARLAGVKVVLWRLFLGAMFGAFYTLLLVLPIFKALPLGQYIIFHVFLNVGVASVIVRLAFGKHPVKKFLKALGYFYLVTFIAGGAALSIYFIAGSSPVEWIFSWITLGDSYAWLYLIAAFFTILVGRYGWNIIREKLFKEEYQLNLQIWIDDKFVEVRGLIDTGNMLKDPVTNLPVIVVESEALLELFSPEVQAILKKDGVDLVDKVEQLLYIAGMRFRIIPYASLGNESGLLIGCRPDRVEVSGEKQQATKKVIIGLHQGALDLEGDYQALLHRELLEAM